MVPKYRYIYSKYNPHHPKLWNFFVKDLWCYCTLQKKEVYAWWIELGKHFAFLILWNFISSLMNAFLMRAFIRRKIKLHKMNNAKNCLGFHILRKWQILKHFTRYFTKSLISKEWLAAHSDKQVLRGNIFSRLN